MKDFNEKMSDFVLTDEDLKKVSGGASSGEKRTVVLCPICNCKGTYGSASEALPYVLNHYKCVFEAGITKNLEDYLISVWNAGIPVPVSDEE